MIMEFLRRFRRGSRATTFIATVIAFGLCGWASNSWSKSKSKSKTEAGACLTCKSGSKHKGGVSRLPVKKSKGKKKKSSKGASYACPQGHRAIHSRCPALEPQIRKILGAKNVACYSNLFGVEGGCSVHVKHDPKKAHNPHAGVGLCAIESSPAVRKRNRRGPACNSIGTAAGQIKCCAHLMRSTNAKYFGTVRCGNTPRCY